jgi:hypothetical protein
MNEQKVKLPLDENSYNALDHALNKDQICWSKLTEVQKTAYNRFGIPESQYMWNDLVKSDNYFFSDLMAIYRELKFYEQLQHEGFNSKKEMLGMELPLDYEKYELLRRGVDEDRIILSDFSEELLENYTSFNS